MFLFGDTLAHEEYNAFLQTCDVKVGLLHLLRSHAFGPYLDPRSHMIDPLKVFGDKDQ
jgi:hypothetical protein